MVRICLRLVAVSEQVIRNHPLPSGFCAVWYFLSSVLLTSGILLAIRPTARTLSTPTLRTNLCNDSQAVRSSMIEPSGIVILRRVRGLVTTFLPPFFFSVCSTSRLGLISTASGRTSAIFRLRERLTLRGVPGT